MINLVQTFLKKPQNLILWFRRKPVGLGHPPDLGSVALFTCGGSKSPRVTARQENGVSGLAFVPSPSGSHWEHPFWASMSRERVYLTCLWTPDRLQTLVSRQLDDTGTHCRLCANTSKFISLPMLLSDCFFHQVSYDRKAAVLCSGNFPNYTMSFPLGNW